jgi:hypothetical protein
MSAVADAPDVHARAQPDMLQRTQRLDLALVVIVFGFFGHSQIDWRKMEQTATDENENGKVPG